MRKIKTLIALSHFYGYKKAVQIMWILNKYGGSLYLYDWRNGGPIAIPPDGWTTPGPDEFKEIDEFIQACKNKK